MARAKTNSVGELMAVAEIKDLLLSIDAKLDLLLKGNTTPTGACAEALATTVTHQKPVGPKDLGPDSWTEEELKDWINDLDGVTRYCVENGGMTAQEVWVARQEACLSYRSEALGRAEEAMKAEARRAGEGW